MHVFYTPDIQTHAELPEEEAAHAVRVLRLQAGDEVMLTDGKGCFYRAEISTATNKRCLVNILETLPQAPLWKGHLHIAMAPTKNMDRTEWFAEKATEIATSPTACVSITPLRAMAETTFTDWAPTMIHGISSSSALTATAT